MQLQYLIDMHLQRIATLPQVFCIYFIFNFLLLNVSLMKLGEEPNYQRLRYIVDTISFSHLLGIQDMFSLKILFQNLPTISTFVYRQRILMTKIAKISLLSFRLFWLINYRVKLSFFKTFYKFLYDFILSLCVLKILSILKKKKNLLLIFFKL